MFVVMLVLSVMMVMMLSVIVSVRVSVLGFVFVTAWGLGCRMRLT